MKRGVALAFNNHASVVRLNWQKSQVKIANWYKKNVISIKQIFYLKNFMRSVISGEHINYSR